MSFIKIEVIFQTYTGIPADQKGLGADGEIFYTLKEAQVLIEEWRLEYNTFRPHS
jgi:transposase InsO family protein